MRQYLKAQLRPLKPWWGLLKQFPWPLMLGAGLMLLTALAAVGLLALSGWFIAATGLAGLMLAAGLSVMLDVYIPGGGIRFFALLRTVTRYGERVYNHQTVLKLLAEIRTLLFRRLVQLPLASLRQQHSVDWLNRLTSDIDAMDSLYLRQIAPPIVAGLTVLAVAILFSMFYWPAAVAVLCVALGLLLWLVIGQSVLGLNASRVRTQALAQLRYRVVEHCQGLAELESYGSLSWHQAHLEQAQQTLHANEQRLLGLTALGNALSSLGLGLLLWLVLMLAIWAYQQGLISGPIVVMMPLAVLALNEVFANLPASFTRFGQTLASAERLNQLGRAAEQQAQAQAVAGLPPQYCLPIELKNVSVHYPQSIVPALDKLDLSVHEGDKLAIIGASGAGKSTLLQLLLGDISINSGRIQVAGHDLAAVARAAWYTHLAVLSQQNDLFDVSIADNLRLAQPHANEAALMAVLRLVELDQWVAGLAEGLDSRVGEQGVSISGGQAQRLCLARTLLRVPQAALVLLDEPLAGLDQAMAARIAQRLDAYLDDKTVVVFLHQVEDWPCEQSYRRYFL